MDKINIIDYLVGHNDCLDIKFLPEIKQTSTKKSVIPDVKKSIIPKIKKSLNSKKNKNNDNNLIDKNEENFIDINDEDIIDDNLSNENFEDDIDENEIIILEKLKITIPSAYIEKKIFDKESELTFYSFNYNHMYDTCVHGNKNHEHLGGYAYISKNKLSVNAGCYSKNCEKSAVRIASFMEFSFWENIEPELIEDIGETCNINDNNEKILETHNNDIEQIDDQIDIEIENELNNKKEEIMMAQTHKSNKIIRFNTKHILKNKRIKKEITLFVKKQTNKALCLKSIMGSGKTRMLRYMLTKFFHEDGNKKRILVISSRRSYADDIMNTFKDFNFINYKNQNGDLRDHDRLIISLESLHRLFSYDYIKMYDLLIFDESENMLNQLFCKTVQNKKETSDRLNELILYCKKIVALDADQIIEQLIS